ncbi:hypothetical protein [Brevirhabdus sp.]|uniref:hypothetical protein n=1 Tax=Brevirhabdus sp. TaxID=2004514 RepID=UPI004059593F
MNMKTRWIEQIVRESEKAQKPLPWSRSSKTARRAAPPEEAAPLAERLIAFQSAPSAAQASCP